MSFRAVLNLAALLAGLALAACATIGERGSAAKPAAPGKPAFTQADLIGLDAEAIDELLGTPALVRREGAGEFRRYALADCALIVILFANDEGAAAAAHLDAAAKSSSEEKPDLDLCLARGLAEASS
ncbi:MAG: hypothetical protein WD076_08155 [Parvularculaceae bacterium]